MWAVLRQFGRAVVGPALLAGLLLQGLVVVGFGIWHDWDPDEVLPLALAWPVAMACILAVRLATFLLGARPSRLAKWHTKVVGPLVESAEEYCLVLRPFGYDGRLVLPVLPATKGKRPVQAAIRRVKPIEQVIAESVRGAKRLGTYCVVDQGTLLAPPGPTYLRAPNDGWRGSVHRLIARAHTIFVILPPSGKVGAGLEWEIATIATLGLQTRVIFVLHPPEQVPDTPCPPTHRLFGLAALLRHGTGAPAAELRGRALEYLEQSTGPVIAARVRDGAAPEAWVTLPSNGKSTFCTTATYLPGLLQFLDGNYRDLAGLGVGARYAAQDRPMIPVPDAWVTDGCLICAGPRRS